MWAKARMATDQQWDSRDERCEFSIDFAFRKVGQVIGQIQAPTRQRLCQRGEIDLVGPSRSSILAPDAGARPNKER